MHLTLQCVQPLSAALAHRRRRRSRRRHSATTPTSPAAVDRAEPDRLLGDRDIFITPSGDTSTYANGPEILSPSGKVVWFDPALRARPPPTSARRPTTASPC